VKVNLNNLIILDFKIVSSLCDQIKIIIEEYKQKVNVKVIDMPRLSIRVRKSIKHSEECISILIGVVNEDQNNIKRLSKRISLLDRDKKNLILEKFSEEYEKNTENGYYEYDHVISENENVYQTENTHKDNSIDESFEVINEYYVVDKIDDSTNNQIIPKQFEAKKLSIDALNSKEDGLNILSSIERFENNFSVRKSLKLIKENENNKLNIIEDNTYYDEDEIEHTNIIYFENSKDHTKEISFISINLLMKIFMEASEKSEKYKIDNNILKGFILQKSGIITTNNFIELMYSICKLIASHSLDSKLVNGLGIIFINWIYYRYEDEIFGNDEIIDKMINFLEKLETLTPIINFKLKSIEIKTLLTILKSEQIKPIDNYDLGNISIIRFISVMKIKKLLDLDQTYDLSNKFISSIFSSTERILPVTMKEYFDVTQWSEIEVARQITLITHFIFCSIHPKELINSKWTKHNKYTESPNVTKIIERFNKISAWICEEILAYDKARLRAGAIEKFILIAKELRNINNFNDAFAVIIALNSFHIKSLKKSWNKVSLERLVIFKELEELFSYSRNFFHLREEISKVESEPCIPYFGYFLKELAFLDEGPKYLKEKNMVNIEKIKKVQKVLDNISKYQSFIYRYKPIYKLSFLADPSPLNEDQLTDISERLGIIITLKFRTIFQFICT